MAKPKPAKDGAERPVEEKDPATAETQRKILARMDELNWGVADLLRQSGSNATHPTVTRWLKGNVLPRFHDIALIARALGLPMEYLADEKASSPQQLGIDLADDDRRILELAHQAGAPGVRAVLEMVAKLGTDEAIARLMLLRPLPIVSPSAPTSGGNHSGAKRPDAKPASGSK